MGLIGGISGSGDWRRMLLRAMFLAVLVPGIWSASLSAQAPPPLTLPQAVSMALEKNPLRKAAMADTRISLAAVRESKAPLMPKIMFGEDVTRGNNPVFVFGSKLNQQRFAAADFALNQLNFPTPLTNWSSRFSGQWNLFDGLQNWNGVKRANFAQQASDQQLERTDQELVFHVVQVYYGVLLAQKQLEVAQDGVKTAEATESSSRARVESGLAVQADAVEESAGEFELAAAF